MTRALLEQALDALEDCDTAIKHLMQPAHPEVQITKTSATDVMKAIRAHLAKPQGEPAWHDAPTVPGLWVVGSRCLHINELDLPIYERSNCRWYGPIPADDGGKP